jgi:hypothetical protein
MIALAPKTYSCSINLQTTATKCKGCNKRGKLNFKDYFDVYTDKKAIQETNNNMQMKKDLENNERVLMTNISVTKNVLTATHTKYRVSKDFSTCTPLFLSVNE